MDRQLEYLEYLLGDLMRKSESSKASSAMFVGGNGRRFIILLVIPIE
jgi:hypothetical protein